MTTHCSWSYLCLVCGYFMPQSRDWQDIKPCPPQLSWPSVWYIVVFCWLICIVQLSVPYAVCSCCDLTWRVCRVFQVSSALLDSVTKSKSVCGYFCLSVSFCQPVSQIVFFLAFFSVDAIWVLQTDGNVISNFLKCIFYGSNSPAFTHHLVKRRCILVHTLRTVSHTCLMQFSAVFCNSLHAFMMNLSGYSAVMTMIECVGSLILQPSTQWVNSFFLPMFIETHKLTHRNCLFPPFSLPWMHTVHAMLKASYLVETILDWHWLRI